MFQSLKNILKLFMPNWLLTRYRVEIMRPLINDINALDIEAAGLESGLPWVKLTDGFRFYGLPVNEGEAVMYGIIQSELINQNISFDVFGVVYEIISRYQAPRSLPGELQRFKSSFDRGRDPLNDFDFSQDMKVRIAEVFKPDTGDVILDIGACHGFGTLRLAEHIGEKGQIFAFEPNPLSAEILRRNVEANSLKNIKVLELAVSNQSKKSGVLFYDGVATGNSLRGDVLENLGIQGIEQIAVDICTGDEVMAEFGVSEINFLSITVNGGEPEVLEGLSRTIAASPSLVVTTPGWYYRDGERLDKKLVGQLKEMGFAHVYSGTLGRVIAWR
jgi:FkbM family methyltransferase